MTRGELGNVMVWRERERDRVCVCMCVCAHVCSVVSDSVTPWRVAHQSPLSMKFSRQEYWHGLLFPPPGDLPDPSIKPSFPASLALAGRFFTTMPPGKSMEWVGEE